MFRVNRSIRLGPLPSGVIVAVGTALSAARMDRTSATPTTYPFTTSNTRPIDWQDGDIGVMQVSADPTFTTGVTEVTNTLFAATTTYNWGLAAIVTPQIRYARLGAWRGVRPGALNWSNIVGVGDAVAPTITSSAAPSGFQFVVGSLALTADKGSTWELVGGTGFAQFSISGNALSWLSQSATGTLQAIVRATSYFGVASADQTVTLTIAANTASAFTFSPQLSATNGTTYTSNTITVAGLQGGASAPITISGAGTYSKNGGAYTSSPGTVVNGDTVTVRLLSSTPTDTTTITIGVTTGSYSVTTSASLSAAKLTVGTGATGAGTDRSQYVDVPAGGLSFTSINTGAANLVKSPDTPPSKFHFEMTLTTLAVNFYIGVTDSARAVGPAVFTKPGSSGNGAGFTAQLDAGATAQSAFTFNGAAASGTLGSNMAVGDVFSLDVDMTTNTVIVKQKVGATITTVGTYVLASQIPTNWRAFVGGSSGDAGSVNFGATAFAIAPASGHTGW